MYMAANKLVINVKTHLPVLLLLWCIVSDNLKWRNHILDSEQAHLKLLTSRVNALSCLCSALRGTSEPMVLWCPMSAIWSSCGEAVRVICSTPHRSSLTRLPGWSQEHQGTCTHLPGGSYCQAVCSVSVHSLGSIHSDSGVTVPVQGTASDVQELTPINTIKQGHV